MLPPQRPAARPGHPAPHARLICECRRPGRPGRGGELGPRCAEPAGPSLGWMPVTHDGDRLNARSEAWFWNTCRGPLIHSLLNSFHKEMQPALMLTTSESREIE